MKPRSTVVLVIAGYLVALVIAWGVVSLHMAAAPDRQSASGIFAFGDGLLFLAVCGLAAVPATGAALFFLRPYPTFWRTVSAGACVIAAAGVAAFVETVVFVWVALLWFHPFG